jgi:hypothetical protein
MRSFERSRHLFFWASKTRTRAAVCYARCQAKILASRLHNTAHNNRKSRFFRAACYARLVCARHARCLAHTCITKSGGPRGLSDYIHTFSLGQGSLRALPKKGVWNFEGGGEFQTPFLGLCEMAGLYYSRPQRLHGSPTALVARSEQRPQEKVRRGREGGADGQGRDPGRQDGEDRPGPGGAVDQTDAEERADRHVRGRDG